MDNPTTLGEIYAQRDYYAQRLNRARARIAAAEKTVEQCQRHTVHVRMVQQLAALLEPYFPQHKLYVLGPFGLTNQMAIHVNDPAGDADGRTLTVGSMAFRPDSGRLKRVDHTRNTGEYPAGSIGAINGLNYTEAELPDSIGAIAELLRASFNA